ncbi:MAG: pitrilysin family protein [Gemmatimonadota bacterium]
MNAITIRLPRTTVALLAVAATGMVAAPQAAGQALTPADIEYPPLNEIEIPQAERVEMPNGMVVFLLEEHELPLINVSVRIRTGSRYEPVEKVGLASITASVMRTGGAGDRTGAEVDLFLEDRAASLGGGIGSSVGTAGMGVLKESFGDVFPVLADMLRRPQFEADKIEEAKVQRKSAIARRNDSPGSITGREFAKLVYGAASPYARHTENATIDAITRQDLIDFHAKYYHPNQIMLGVTGDFDRAEVLAAIESEFGDWERAEVDLPREFQIAPAKAGTVYFVEKTDLTQSNFRVGHLGTTVDNPDYFAVQVMNKIFGQGFASRLFNKIRSEKGLAYSIFGSVGASYDYPGIFQVGGQTKLESTAEALEAVLAEIEYMKSGEVSEEELNYAKNAFLNSFIFNFDSPGEIVGRQMLYEYYGYPADFLQQIRTGITAVTTADVQAAAQRHLHPDQLVMLAVADPERLDRPLDEFGEIVTLDVTIPE